MIEIKTTIHTRTAEISEISKFRKATISPINAAIPERVHRVREGSTKAVNEYRCIVAYYDYDFSREYIKVV